MAGDDFLRRGFLEGFLLIGTTVFCSSVQDMSRRQGDR
jgi:hypothetical protein